MIAGGTGAPVATKAQRIAIRMLRCILSDSYSIGAKASARMNGMLDEKERRFYLLELICPNLCLHACAF